MIEIAGVSCVPTTARMARKVVRGANMLAMILARAMGANICDVITAAILAAIYSGNDGY